MESHPINKVKKQKNNSPSKNAQNNLTQDRYLRRRDQLWLLSHRKIRRRLAKKSQPAYHRPKRSVLIALTLLSCLVCVDSLCAAPVLTLTMLTLLSQSFGIDAKAAGILYPNDAHASITADQFKQANSHKNPNSIDELPEGRSEPRAGGQRPKQFSKNNKNVICTEKTKGTTAGKVCQFFGETWYLKQVGNLEERFADPNRPEAKKKTDFEDTLQNFAFIRSCNGFAPRALAVSEVDEENPKKTTLYLATEGIEKYESALNFFRREEFDKYTDPKERVKAVRQKMEKILGYESVLENDANAAPILVQKSKMADFFFVSLFVGDLGWHPDNWGIRKNKFMIPDADYPQLTFNAFYKNAVENFTKYLHSVGACLSLNDLKDLKRLAITRLDEINNKILPQTPKPARLNDASYALLLESYIAAANETLIKYSVKQPSGKQLDKNQAEPALNVAFGKALEKQKDKLEAEGILHLMVSGYQKVKNRKQLR